MLDKIIEYCKDNLPLVAICAGCVVLILFAIIGLCVKKSKAKKKAAKSKAVQPVPARVPAPTIAKEEVNPEPVKEEIKTEPVKEEPKKAETKPAAAKTEPKKAETKPATAKTEPKKAEVKPAPAKKTAVSKAAAPVKTEEKPTEKKEPVAEKNPTTKKSTRYSGKWVICRVMTAAQVEGEAIEETFFFELRASNGEKLLTSEEYTTYNGALMGINTHKTNIEKGNFRITLSKKGDYIFKLLNGKNMLLCMGEHYTTRANCESAIESAKRFAATAIIDENVQDIVLPSPAEEDDAPAPTFDENILGKWIIHMNESEEGDKVYYFELFASNGEKLLSSEEYTTYVGAANGIETHKANIEKDNFRVSFTKRGDYIYKLLNGNNQLLCLGEHYKTRRRCENAIESVKRFAKVSPVYADPKTIK